MAYKAKFVYLIGFKLPLTTKSVLRDEVTLVSVFKLFEELALVRVFVLFGEVALFD